MCRKKDSKNKTLGKWMAKAFPVDSPETHTFLSIRNPSDFNVPYSEATLISAVGYICSDLQEKWNNGPKQAILPNKKLLLAWENDGVLLILRKIKPGEKILPSFKCNENNNETEETICSSNALSGWDQSMAEAFRKAIARASRNDAQAYVFQTKKTKVSDVSNLMKFQNKWLQKRNNCTVDKECITSQYSRQVNTLESISIEGKTPDALSENDEKITKEDMMYISKLTKKKK
ncbi:lysozyme inhibitor LprI family protein [Acetobacter thailandicus]|uniref:lysozyme inhibitor LprI family protein n=1 Tax=Acetobacter thailandicus TaxID=1502842 RepID=UPI001BAB6C8C|nr:lysozyme inhibitor LprI family protein [Acetobacter thailandicus]MBS1002589.1 DUF1311 domain-containing protein [Acetobacter thailandicus]